MHVFVHEFNLGANKVTRIQFVTVVASGNGKAKAKGAQSRDKTAWNLENICISPAFWATGMGVGVWVGCSD